MNCFAGLAWISSALSHLPKQEKMKTTPEHSPNEETKRLFRQLFEVQYKFERYADYCDPQVTMIISMIDQLLEKMLQYSDE